MADLAAFPFLAPHSLRRPPVGGLPVVAGLVPNPMSWWGGGAGGPEGRGQGGPEGGGVQGGRAGARAATPLGRESAITSPHRLGVSSKPTPSFPESNIILWDFCNWDRSWEIFLPNENF